MKKEKSLKNKLLSYATVFKGVKLPWITIILALASSIVMMDSEITVATLTADIIDSSQKAINAAVLAKYILSAAVAAVALILELYFTRKMEEKINLGIRIKLWNKIIRLPIKYYDEDNGDELVTRVTSDAAAPSSLFTLALSCITCIVTSITAFSQLFDYNERLALYSLTIIPLTIIVSIVFSVLQFKLGVYSTVTMAGSLGYLAERARNFKLIKSAVTEKAELLKGKNNFKNMYKAEFLSWLVVAGYQLGSGLFSVMFIIIVFVLGAPLVKSGDVTIGELTGFYSITGVVSLQLMQLFMNIGSVWGTFGTMKKISAVMYTDGESNEGTSVCNESRDIVFDNVSFSYDGERDAVKNLSFTIPAGKVCAVIGGNGAGKSTLFKLITRLYEPDSGKILYGDEDISAYKLYDWRDRFSYVSQKNSLIGGTVRDNITYGLKEDVTDEQLFEAAKKANCYDFIMKKPNGFSEDVGLSGSSFSGGQGQCISIARAMLKNSSCLLLDEATSNLDVVSEASVTDAVNTLMNGKTTVMIAHSYAAVRNADYVAVMKDGTLEAFGTPEELSQSNDYYKAFCKTI